jgi:PhzF family phenazine biosynthesis protein
MRVPFWQIDSFTTQRFAGNPAAVMLLDAFPADAVLRTLAAENNLSETAFLVADGDDYRLRWFTPKVEVPLCGHGTLASAAVVMERLSPGRERAVFHTASGALAVDRDGDTYSMDFPARPSARVPSPASLAQALGTEPVEVFVNEFNYLARLADAQAVRQLRPDFAAIARHDRPGVIVTAASDDPRYDFVSRYFAPAKGVPEDPVTGGAHCMLAPYWAPLLGKTEFVAAQLSERGGEMAVSLRGDRVQLRGTCVFYLEGFAEA